MGDTRRDGAPGRHAACRGRTESGGSRSGGAALSTKRRQSGAQAKVWAWAMPRPEARSCAIGAPPAFTLPWPLPARGSPKTQSPIVCPCPSWIGTRPPFDAHSAAGRMAWRHPPRRAWAGPRPQGPIEAGMAPRRACRCPCALEGSCASISCLALKCYDRRCREGRYLSATFEDGHAGGGHLSRLPNPPCTHEEATDHG